MKDYKGGTVGAAGEAFDPSPANLDSRIKIVNDGSLKAGLLHKKNRGETVSLVLTLHYGNRGFAQGPDGRGRDAPRPDDGRHEEARSPGPARGAGCAGHPHLTGRRAAAAGVAAVAGAAGAAVPRGN